MSASRAPGGSRPNARLAGGSRASNAAAARAQLWHLSGTRPGPCAPPGAHDRRPRGCRRRPGRAPGRGDRVPDERSPPRGRVIDACDACLPVRAAGTRLAAARRSRASTPCASTPTRFPAPLRELSQPPPVLYATRIGLVTGLDEPVAVVVGSRRPSEYGRTVAYSLGRGLGAAGVPVVSGLALGIDAIAQRGCLDGGGCTIAVLACGVDVAYPRTQPPPLRTDSRARLRGVRDAARHTPIPMAVSGAQPHHGRARRRHGRRGGGPAFRHVDHGRLRRRPGARRRRGARPGHGRRRGGNERPAALRAPRS